MASSRASMTIGVMPHEEPWTLFRGSSESDMREAITDRGAPVPRWLSAGVVFGAFAVFAMLERRRPLRRRIEPQWRRDARNLAVAAVSAVALRIAEKPVIEPLAEAVERRRRGLLKQMSLLPRREVSEPRPGGGARGSAVSESGPWVVTSMRTFEIVAGGLAGGAIAAALWHGVRQRRPADPAPSPASESPAPPPILAASRASAARMADRSQPPLWVKIAGTAYVLVLVPIYWRHYGPSNFLWFSDLALFALCAALWFDGSLLVGMAAIGVLALEIAWSVDFLCGGRLLDLAGYMFDTSKPLYLRALSLFHLAMPPAILWMLRRQGYDRRSLPLQTAFAWVVMLATYALTDPEKNINWVFGPGSKPQHAVSPLLYLAALMASVPLVVYLPTHLALAQVFLPPGGSRAARGRATA